MLIIVMLIVLLMSINCDSGYVDINDIRKIENISVFGGKDDSLKYYKPLKLIKCNNEIFVLDSGNNRIVVIDSCGDYIRTIGSIGQGPGELHKPTDFHIKENKEIYVFDYGNRRIQVFDFFGYYKTTINLNNIRQRLNKNFVLDNNGYIYLNTPTSKTLFLVVDKNGKIIREFGAPIRYKALNKQISANSVEYILDENNNIYVLFCTDAILRKYNINNDTIINERIIKNREIKKTKDSIKLLKDKNPGKFKKGVFHMVKCMHYANNKLYIMVMNKDRRIICYNINLEIDHMMVLNKIYYSVKNIIIYNNIVYLCCSGESKIVSYKFKGNN